MAHSDESERAALVAHKIRTARRLGASIDAPEYYRVGRLLARHSTVVRLWVRCETATMTLLALGLGGLVFGTAGLMFDIDRPWSLVVTLLGGTTLAALSIAQWFAGQHALLMAAGMLIAETPTPPRT
jgi:hypothetical protein